MRKAKAAIFNGSIYAGLVWYTNVVMDNIQKNALIKV